MTKKSEGARISAKVDGVDRAKIPLKAVVYIEEKEEIKILAETPVEKDEFEFDLGVAAEDLPETAKLVIVPQEVKSKSLIRRLDKAGHAPSATIHRNLMLSRGGKLTADDLPLKSVDDVVRIWSLKRRVCGRVIKRDPVTGEECPVPGATVRVLDVDLNLLCWHPYPSLLWCWLFPFWPRRREEIATTTTNECGHFCVDIPYSDIDAILRWRLRFRCLPEILQWPRVIDAIDLGVKPDLRVYPELERLPELEPKPKPEPWPGPGPVIPEIPLREPAEAGGASMESAGPTGAIFQAPRIAERVSKFHTEPQFEPVRQALFTKRALFEPVKPDELPVLERAAFPKSIAPPAMPDDETLLGILSDEKMLKEVRSARPIVRLLRCWAELVPEWHLFLDVPDIVFKVEQDIDGDGALETIYDQGYFDVNWNLTEPTINVVIEAWPNAICVPHGQKYQTCTTTGIVGISEMPVDPDYLNAEGYAVRVNRPKPNGARPKGETPFCNTVRLVGCPNYGTAVYYKVFYRYEDGPETHFNESWYVYHLSAGTTHHVVPDANGFYPVLTPPNDYFPYHTLLNWRTYNYPDGRYTVRLALYDAEYKPIETQIRPINVVIDNSKPSRVDFLRLRYRVGTGAWKTVSLHCPIIKRPKNKDIELEIQYNVAATHLRDVYISFVGCGGNLGSETYWHKNVNDNNVTRTWTVTVPGDADQGGYCFYLEVRSRAFNGVGGLDSNWYFDPLHIWRSNTLYVVILDS